MKTPTAKSRFFQSGKAKAERRTAEMGFFPCNAANWKNPALRQAVS